MKVILDIPDWAMEGFIRMLSNKELFIYKEPGIDQPFHVKRERCNYCGECCFTAGDVSPFGGDDEGRCLKLVKEGSKWVCTAGADTPLRCLEDPGKHKKEAFGCPITYEINNGE